MFPLDNVLTEVRYKQALGLGDYHAEFTSGKRPPLVFERKEISDLFGSIANKERHERLRARMIEAKDRGIQMVLIIEGSLRRVYGGFSRSRFPGTSCVQALFTMWSRYDVLPVFCNSREEMAAYITESFKAIGREWNAQKD